MPQEITVIFKLGGYTLTTVPVAYFLLASVQLFEGTSLPEEGSSPRWQSENGVTAALLV